MPNPFIQTQVGSKPRVKNHGSVSTDLALDLRCPSGGFDTQIVTLGAAINFTADFTKCPPEGITGYTVLILLNSATNTPTWADNFRFASDTEPTYTDDFPVILLLETQYGGAVVRVQEISLSQAAVLGAEMVDDPLFSSTSNWTEGAGASVANDVLTLTAATSTTVEAAPLTAVAAAVFLVLTVIDSISGGSLKPNVGSTDGTAHTTAGTKVDVITATDTDGLELIASGCTAVVSKTSVRRLY